MANTPIYYPDTGGPTGFALTDWTDPMTFVAWTNFVISENIREMEEEGLVWADQVPDTSAWSAQDTALTQQNTLIDSLEEQTEISTEWKTRLTALKTLITTLLALSASPAGLTLRGILIAMVETALQTATRYTQNAEEPSGEILENILTAIQDLKYNDEVLEIPATPRPIRIHLQSKTIQT